MKITIMLEVPEGTTLTTSNDSEYLDEKNRLISGLHEANLIIHARDHQMEILRKEISNLKAEKPIKFEPSPNSPLKPSGIVIDPRPFYCLKCKETFQAATLSAQTSCPKCGELADMSAPPQDDTNSIPCITCGVIYNKTKGGKHGTCPNCTTVRCPTCKQPATLAEMEGGPKCLTCRKGGPF